MSKDTQIEQIESEKEIEMDAPKTLWTTALGRAHFGFRIETHNHPAFNNDQYIATLAEVENQMSQNLGKLVI